MMVSKKIVLLCTNNTLLIGGWLYWWVGFILCMLNDIMAKTHEVWKLQFLEENHQNNAFSCGIFSLKII